MGGQKVVEVTKIWPKKSKKRPKKSWKTVNHQLEKFNNCFVPWRSPITSKQFLRFKRLWDDSLQVNRGAHFTVRLTHCLYTRRLSATSIAYYYNLEYKQ